MPTTWNTRTVPTTSWGLRPIVITKPTYDNTYVYDAVITYDYQIDGTVWITRVVI